VALERRSWVTVRAVLEVKEDSGVGSVSLLLRLETSDQLLYCDFKGLRRGCRSPGHRERCKLESGRGSECVGDALTGDGPER
jgi:hypothetical protein